MASGFIASQGWRSMTLAQECGWILLRQEPMNVAALGADVASAGGIAPVKVEERRGGGVQLRLLFPKRVMAANQTL